LGSGADPRDFCQRAPLLSGGDSQILPRARHFQSKGTTMPTLLVVEVSPRFDRSTSRSLTGKFVEKWKAATPSGNVVVRDLAKTHLPFVDLPWIGAAFGPPGQHSPEQAGAIKVSDDLVAELKAADHIVIGTPIYNFSVPAILKNNFSVPAILKAYIDHIVRVGLTFTTNGGLVTGKRATAIMTAGGDFAPGARYESYNLATPYLRQILSFIGITDVNVILAGRSRAVDQGETTMEAFVGQFEREVSAAAIA
jgi:FMN-dependent NADH-azoreductase